MSKEKIISRDEIRSLLKKQRDFARRFSEKGGHPSLPTGEEFAAGLPPRTPLSKKAKILPFSPGKQSSQE